MQLDLFARPADDRARVIAHRMIDILGTCAGPDGWLRAAEVCLYIGCKPDEAGKRAVRSGAEASRGAIIIGQQGYKLTALATVEEIRHAINILESQARKMADRAAAIRAAGHRALACA